MLGLREGLRGFAGFEAAIAGTGEMEGFQFVSCFWRVSGWFLFHLISFGFGKRAGFGPYCVAFDGDAVMFLEDPLLCEIAFFLLPHFVALHSKAFWDVSVSACFRRS